MIRCRLLVLAAVALAVAGSVAAQPPPALGPPDHGFFTRLPKHFARLGSVEPRQREVTVELEGGATLTRPLRRDADVFAGPDLGRLADLATGQRVWIVF